MSSVAFVLLAFMLGAYVLLDGFDLGIATIAPFVGKDEEERGAAMRAIGPFWNGNEVWLVAAGGALFALFPKAYASAFSGFYLPFVVVLWLLMFRGIAMELRGHFATPMWRDFWDFCFSGSSALLVVLFGVALGNLLRGVPLDADGYFTGSFGFLLNPYALLVGLTALAAIAMHGAAFALLRIEGPPADRARKALPALAGATAAGFVATTVYTLAIHGFTAPWVAVFPAAAIGALIFVLRAARAGNGGRAFLASSALLASLFGAAAATLYPHLLTAFPGPGGIDISSAAPSPAALVSALAVVLVGVVAVCIYGSIVLVPIFRQKVGTKLKP